MKIKKGDTVIVRTGKDKGKTGAVIDVLKAKDKVVVDGVNIVTKHQKNRRVRSQGQIVEKPAPVHVSNVALVSGGKPVRVGYTVTGTGKDRKKVRVARPSGKEL